MLTYLLAEGRHRPNRALGSLAGVALGVALFVSLVSVADGFREAAHQPLADIGADIVFSRPDGQNAAGAQTTRGVRQPFGLALLTTAEVDQVQRLWGVGGATGGLLLWDFSASTYQTLLGVDLAGGVPEAPASETGRSSEVVGPQRLVESIVAGRFFSETETEVVVVDQHYAAFFSLKPGAVVEIGEQSFEVVGIVETGGSNQGLGADFYLPISDAQSLAGLSNDQVNQVYVRVDKATGVGTVIADAEAQLGDISAVTDQSIVSVMGGITQISDRFAAIAAVVALMGGLVLTGVTLHAGINLRSRDVGVMKATGWQTRDVVRLFTVEGIALSSLGAALGIFLAWLTIVAFAQVPIGLPSLSGSTPNLSEVVSADSYTIAASLSWPAVLVAVTTAVSVATVVSVVSVRRVSRLKPADTLRS
ncbi:MAG: ABC transporter permease [Acidimicrobiia bacterium]